MTEPKRVSIMGVTGSIGSSARSVILAANKRDIGVSFEVEAVAGGRDSGALADAAIALGARLAVVADEAAYTALKDGLAGSGIEVAAGAAALAEAASRPVDRVLAAVSGAAGLGSTLAAIRAGNDVALANKESIVCAGEILKAEAARSGARILPVDSEHNAIFQVLDRARAPEGIILTASGGPFRTSSLEDMRRATPETAAAHPNWSMGVKNSIDSATLMNKALELIEACYLFDMPESQVEVVVHPQSIIHSLVRYPDGSVLAQMGVTDMRTPIAHALTWPDSIRTEVPRLSLAEVARLDFEEVDGARFPAIRLARQASRHGCLASTVFNSANEAAVAAFVAGQCGFLDINYLVEATLDAYCEGRFGDQYDNGLSIDAVLGLDGAARTVATDLLLQRAG